MADIISLKHYLKQFFSNEFDHQTIADTQNTPFVQITHIKLSEQLSVESFGCFLSPPGVITGHRFHRNMILTAASISTGHYLAQDLNSPKIVQTDYSCSDSVVLDDDEAIIITVVASIDDARWVSQSVAKQLRIFYNL